MILSTCVNRVIFMRILIRIFIVIFTFYPILNGKDDEYDRSKNWKPSLIRISYMKIDDLSESDIEGMWGDILSCDGCPSFGRLERGDVVNAAKDALQSIIGGEYTRLTSGSYSIGENSAKDAWIFKNEKVCVVLGKEDGRVWGCVDTDKQPQFSFADCKIDYLTFECDLTKLSAEELKAYNSVEGLFDALNGGYYANCELPLDAKGAYELAQAAIAEHGLYAWGIKKRDRDARVYYCASSDVLFVSMGNIMQAFDRTTGEPLLMVTYSPHKGRDKSQKILDDTARILIRIRA